MLPLIREIFSKYNKVAVIGMSADHTRPSNRVARYLKGNGFTVYGVNPNHNEKIIDEIECYPTIFDLPESVEIFNVFRRSEFVEEIMNDVLKLEHRPNVFWAQVGVISNEAKLIAMANDILYIENKCIMTEHSNL